MHIILKQALVPVVQEKKAKITAKVLQNETLKVGEHIF